MAVREEPLGQRVERRLRENEAALRASATRAERRKRAGDRLSSEIAKKLAVLRRAGLTK
jgi:hypothetical protein